MPDQNREPLEVSLSKVLLGDTTKAAVDKINQNSDAILTALDWLEENAGLVDDVHVDGVSVVGEDKIARINHILHSTFAEEINVKTLHAQGDTNEYPIAVLAKKTYPDTETGTYSQVFVPKINVTIKNDTGDINIGTKKVLTSADLGTYSSVRGFGVASLGSDGKVPSTQLPSYVDDVVDGYHNPVVNKFYTEYATQSVTPAKDYYYLDAATQIMYILNNENVLEEYYGSVHGDASQIIPGKYNTTDKSFTKYVFDSAKQISPEPNKIYVDLITNKTFRFNGSTGYVEISKQIALGETETTAYPGNKGKENADEIDFIKYNFASVVDNDFLTKNEIILGDDNRRTKSSGKKIVEYDLIGETNDGMMIPEEKKNDIPTAFMLGYAVREAMEPFHVLDAFRRGKDIYNSDHPDYHKLILVANRDTSITAADSGSAKVIARLMDRGYVPIRIMHAGTIIHTDIEYSQSAYDDDGYTYTIKIAIDASLQEAFTSGWSGAIYFAQCLSPLQQNYYPQSSN